MARRENPHFSRWSPRITYCLSGAVLSLILLRAVAAAGEVQPQFLFKLSNFTGPIPFTSSRLFIDPGKNEVYVMSGGAVSIFNGSGMEVYRLDYDREMGVIYDAAVDPRGDVLLLAYKDAEPRLLRCNYRLELREPITIKDLPPEFSGLRPNRLAIQGDQFFLADLGRMKIVVLDATGAFVRGYDVGALLNFDEKTRADTGMVGFSLDPEGNILFTIPVIAQAYRMAPDGSYDAFGKRGSAPGKFGVISGIAADDQGHYLVADKLRCVVLVFDRDFKFITEFGGRSRKPGRLIAPSEMATSSGGLVYVSQLGRQGVSVYRVSTP